METVNLDLITNEMVRAAEWRRTEASKASQDRRYLEAARALETLAHDVRSLPGTPATERLSFVAPAYDSSTAVRISEFNREIGFSRQPPSAARYVEQLAEELVALHTAQA